MTQRSPDSTILVTGASSQIGHFLLPKLIVAGFSVQALSRRPPETDEPGTRWHRCDIAAGTLPDAPLSGAIHLAPLPLLPPLLPRLAELGAKRVIGFGSTSRYTKAASADPAERAYAADLERAEAAIAEFCEPRNIAWTVFRPTLIYGCGMDKNVSAIARLIRRFRFFPLIGGEGGLRQPVHADDLAAACLAAWEHPAAFNRGYDLSGAEVLSYRAMVERIFVAEGLPPRFLPIPLALVRAGIRLLSLLPRYGYLTTEMADRMAADLAFEHARASADFGYAPRPFEPPCLG
ncbi:MAG: NAD-dependent epimerase/dehydratase family protein [Methylococcaceae bacterium]|nr:NAD-dependent epimerase/dehydratase family protein [Methylococcaceae bacterium]